MDTHDTTALAHYEALIAQRYPPHLAAALAAARYQVALLAFAAPASLPVFRDIVSAVAEKQPKLRRTAGRLLVEVEEAMGVTR